jgi:hypothetical protein
MATTIQEFATERSINYLMHFTRARNLNSILARGLVPRDTLLLEGFDAFNDQHRLDGTHAVCMSIGFPNYKMFYGCQKDNAGETWVILVISPRVLWELDCAFCAANAASNGVTAVPLGQRKGLAAMQAMFADWPSKARAELGLPDNYPTNPQAEVLSLQGVPARYFLGVIVLNEAAKQEVLARHPGLDVRVMAQYFRYRKDFAHWKPQA